MSGFIVAMTASSSSLGTTWYACGGVECSVVDVCVHVCVLCACVHVCVYAYGLYLTHTRTLAHITLHYTGTYLGLGSDGGHFDVASREGVFHNLLKDLCVCVCVCVRESVCV
jgi:hypothetical protein